MIALSDRQLTTPNGWPVHFTVRDGTNDGDVSIGLNVWGRTRGDEYRMTGRSVVGWAIDVGAHIGAWAIPTALDNPGARIIAVEAVPENAELLEQNVIRNGVQDQVTVINAAAAAPGTSTAICHYGYRSDPSANDGYLSAHRFVSETWGARGDPEHARETEAVSLDAILERFGIDGVDLLKIDCEGCEWTFLDTPAVRKVSTVKGEYHGGITGVEDPIGRLHKLLDPTHVVAIWEPRETVSGLFEATRRV